MKLRVGVINVAVEMEQILYRKKTVRVLSSFNKLNCTCTTNY